MFNFLLPGHRCALLPELSLSLFDTHKVVLFVKWNTSLIIKQFV